MRKKQWILRITVITTALAISYFSIRAFEVNGVMKELNRQLEEAEQELDEKTSLYEAMQEEREQMDTLEYIEKVAREKLGMVKSDDIVFKTK